MVKPGEEHADEALAGDGSMSWLQTRSQPRVGARSLSLPCISLSQSVKDLPSQGDSSSSRAHGWE